MSAVVVGFQQINIYNLCNNCLCHLSPVVVCGFQSDVIIYVFPYDENTLGNGDHLHVYSAFQHIRAQKQFTTLN